ncbi:MAG: N-acetyltransferase [Armatimonadetes bacterium]|nr:N-acetyltransferase [Armatimonadota bacterium]
MNITNNPIQGRFQCGKDGHIAVADYHLNGVVMTVTHIIVPPELRGGGVASALAAEVVAHARRENLKIVPQCSFMAAYLEKHPEDGDVRA